MECKKVQNEATCPCTAVGCGNHGICCQCLASHLAKKGLPRCCFPDAESAKDRSFASFAKAWSVASQS